MYVQKHSPSSVCIIACVHKSFVRTMLGYIVHLFWAAWEVVWYLVRIFIFREPVSPAFDLFMCMKCLLIEHFAQFYRSLTPVDRDPTLKVARANGLTKSTGLMGASGSSVSIRSHTEFLSVSHLSFPSLENLLDAKFGTRTTVVFLPATRQTKLMWCTVPIATLTQVIFC